MNYAPSPLNNSISLREAKVKLRIKACYENKIYC